MIKSKKINNINIYSDRQSSDDCSNDYSDNYRTAAFDVYLNLLNSFESKELFLLESLGPKSVDSKKSMIGILPILKIEVTDCFITITGNTALLGWCKTLFVEQKLIETTISFLRYQLLERSEVWEYLRFLDAHFKTSDGGVLAFATFGYNTIHYIENIAGYVQGDMPDITLTCYSTYIEFGEGQVTLHQYEFIGAEAINISQITPHFTITTRPYEFAPSHSFVVKRETSKNEYIQKARTALNHVAKGNVYQIQVGQKILVESDISPLEVYARLRLMNPSPYMYLFNCGGNELIGASPESYICIEGDEITMRPIAGTLAKSKIATKDEAIKEFRSNPKEKAEHMMLVDLCRNDLCRVASPESLEVSGLMLIEEYSHVYHMVTTVKACISKGLDKYDVIKASFPAGTMTGAPKIRAIELISELEDSARGVYAGALGIIGLGTNFVNTALCIRTAVERNGTYSLRASAGIVSDSKVEDEYAETLHKMGSIFKAITNEEISCHVM